MVAVKLGWRLKHALMAQSVHTVHGVFKVPGGWEGATRLSFGKAGAVKL